MKVCARLRVVLGVHNDGVEVVARPLIARRWIGEDIALPFAHLGDTGWRGHAMRRCNGPALLDLRCAAQGRSTVAILGHEL